MAATSGAAVGQIAPAPTPVAPAPTTTLPAPIAPTPVAPAPVTTLPAPIATLPAPAPVTTLPAPIATPPAPAPGRPLGRLERESLDEAMLVIGLHVDPSPTGKVIGEIHIVNQEVFSQRDWLFQLLNVFHRTTRPEMLQRELLMNPRDRYDPELIEETIRNLLVTTQPVGTTTFVPPELSSIVVIVPIVSANPGTVDLLVVTRDVWSLRFNTNFQVQQSRLTLLQTSLSENNLFGWRKYLSIGFNLDQGSMQVGPTYFDPNIMGTRLTLVATAQLNYARGTDSYEGNAETVSFRYPLYSLASRWGAGVDVGHQNVVVRRFQGNNLFLEDLMGTPAVEMIPYIYRSQTTTVNTSIVRSFGSAIIQRVTFGHFYNAQSSSVLPSFPFDEMTAQLFLDQFAPLSERRSEPYLRYDMFAARYAVYHDLDSFDLRENRRLGPSLSLQAGYGLPALGADFPGLSLFGAASWTEGPGGSYEQAFLQLAARRREDEWVDQMLQARITLATPIIGRLLRVVVSAEADAVRASTANTPYFVGGDTGLRGYAINAFQGTAMEIGHVELRSMALPVFSQRFGTVLFYDVGDAAPSFAALTPHHDLGVGLRWLIPQLNSAVIRLDWAFATQDAPLTRAGWPGRFSAGFAQVF
jgi:hypothetical protein